MKIEIPNIWFYIWNFAEDNHIKLGKFAPFVFERMLKIKGEKHYEPKITK